MRTRMTNCASGKEVSTTGSSHPIMAAHASIRGSWITGAWADWPCAVVGLLLLIGPGTAFGQLSPADIEALRKQGEAEGWTFKVGENEATRRPLSELCGAVEPPDWRLRAHFDPCTPRDDLPETFDWRDYGACTPVRNQGGCGSCWAFGAVGTVESMLLINESVSTDLSEQWLISCTGSGGCGGGWHTKAYEYLKSNGLQDPCDHSGAVLESAFPYEAWDAPCVCPYPHPYSIYSWAVVGPEGGTPSVEQIKQAIMDYGPVSTCVYVTEAFAAYEWGVFNECESGATNHVVDLVGWDDNQGANGVWILRNSWSEWWGENGYMRISYGCSEIGYATCYVNYAPQDCNNNAIPDRCDLDCEAPGGPCDVVGCGGSRDCNGNRIPDECDIDSGMSTDYNGNGIPDECERDCNGNGVPDECDISCEGDCAGAPGCGESADCQPDGMPDDCQVLGTAVPGDGGSCFPSADNGQPWCDDFEGYSLGPVMGNNWEGWFGDPGMLGIVTSEQNHTAGGSKSLKIQNHDTVHVFTGYDLQACSYWLLRAYVYIPSTMSGDAFFIVLPDYGLDMSWSVQLEMNADAGTISNYFGAESLLLITDDWAEIRCEINFDSDLVMVYYDDEFLATYCWTDPYGSGRGSLGIAVIDLYSPYSSGFYYDDLSLFPAISRDCDGNDVPDECDLADCSPENPSCQDCNANGILDECDIAGDTSEDVNGNGVPDECDPPCADDAECDDGLWCTGVEECIDNLCHRGNDPCPGQMCDEAEKKCVDCLEDAHCDDGLYCNGAEVCDDAGACQQGAEPCPAGLVCDEESDSCLCDDNGDCDDGIACTVDSCDLDTGQCLFTPDNSLCDDGNPCTDDACHAVNGCQSTPNDANSCDDGVFCNGAEACSGGSCVVTGAIPCQDGGFCSERDRACLECLDGSHCDDGDDCTADTCPGGTCAHALLPACQDDDEDGVLNRDDECPGFDDAVDADGDGVADGCDDCPDDADNDTDGDGVCGNVDNCPADANSDQEDADGDGTGDVCDECPNDADDDADDDGLCGDVDNCPDEANPDQEDTDGDGVGDACDDCPDDADNDADGDGVCGDVDNCPANANPNQGDADGDGVGDICDACPNDADNDADDDGVCGDVDQCPDTPVGEAVNADGCADSQLDDDGDGVFNDVDECPNTPAGEEVDDEGCADSQLTDEDAGAPVPSGAGCGIFGMIPLALTFMGLAAMGGWSRRWGRARV